MRARLHQNLPRFLITALAILAGLQVMAQPAPTNQLDYMIIVTGEELLRGVYPDAHTCFITRTLHLLGAHCIGAMIVDDRSEDIKDALRLAGAKARLIMITGGLGPTMNDLTRPALSEATGIPLVESEELLRGMERRFNQERDQLRPTLRRQTLVPSRGTWLTNGNGTAAGLVFEGETNVVVALPGPPRELQPMVTLALIPYLIRKFGVRPPGSTLTIRFVGLGQSQIDQVLREQVALPQGVLVSSLFEGSRVDFAFALPGHTIEDTNRLRQVEATLKKHLGDNIYSNDDTTLEECVGQLLEQRRGKLALVEAGTAGKLAAALQSARTAGHFIAGAWSALDERQLRKLLAVPAAKEPVSADPQEMIQALGRAACQASGSRWAVVVGETQTDEKGARFLWLGLGEPSASWQVRRLSLQGSGEMTQTAAVTSILDQLRRWLNSIEPSNP